MPDMISQLWAVVSERGIECSGLSWNGHNLIGDQRSIDEVQRLMQCETRMLVLEQCLREERDH